MFQAGILTEKPIVVTPAATVLLAGCSGGAVTTVTVTSTRHRLAEPDHQASRGTEGHLPRGARLADRFRHRVRHALDPGTGEQLSARGGMMLKGENHITSFARGKSYSCTFDADGLADHGLLILGDLSTPGTYAIPFDVR